MKSTPELEAEIVRLHYAEHWPVGTIATQLEAHPDQVRRVLGLGEPRRSAPPRPRLLDPYRLFLDDTLARYHVVEQETPLLQKPFTPRTLAKKVRDVLDRVTV